MLFPYLNHLRFSLILVATMVLLTIISCSNNKDNDNLTSTFPFTHSCNNTTNKTCVNYYPEDGISGACLTGTTLSTSKCTASSSVGACSKLPRTLETVYYSGYTSSGAMDADGGRADCNLQGQSQFSTNYQP